MGFSHSISVVQLGEAYMLADRIEDARACADRALKLARQRGERGDEAWALRLLGDIASHHHRPDVATAEAYYGAALALASELGMRPLVAHCHLGLGKLYRRIGKRQEGQEHLDNLVCEGILSVAVFTGSSLRPARYPTGEREIDAETGPGSARERASAAHRRQ